MIEIEMVDYLHLGWKKSSRLMNIFLKDLSVLQPFNLWPQVHCFIITNSNNSNVLINII
jgi:hypothetical protein